MSGKEDSEWKGGRRAWRVLHRMVRKDISEKGTPQQKKARDEPGGHPGKEPFQEEEQPSAKAQKGGTRLGHKPRVRKGESSGEKDFSKYTWEFLGIIYSTKHMDV